MLHVVNLGVSGSLPHPFKVVASAINDAAAVSDAIDLSDESKEIKLELIFQLELQTTQCNTNTNHMYTMQHTMHDQNHKQT